MIKKLFKKLKKIKNSRAIIVTAVIGLVGGYVILNSLAASLNFNTEAESGSRSAGVFVQNDNNASGGKYIMIGRNNTLQLSSAQAGLYSSQINDTETWMTNSFPLLGRPRLIITRHQTPESDERVAVDKIHKTGALAYRYVQYFWGPADKADLDNLINLADHPDWRYCNDGNTPVPGKSVDGTQYYFLDLNEKAVRDNMVTHFKKIKNDYGYDGVFIDIGRGARSGRADAPLFDPSKASSCTQNPVTPGRSFGNTYQLTLTEAKAIGLKTVFNYDRAYVQGSMLPADWYNYIDYALDESVNDNPNLDWYTVYDSNRAAEVDGIGKTIQFIKEELKDANGNLTTDKNDIYYRTSRAKLFSSPVAINAYDPRLYPELTSATLNGPFAGDPSAEQCDNLAAGECVWIRRYSGGMVVVNNNTQNKNINLPLNTQSCRTVKNLYSGVMLGSGGCITNISIQQFPAKSGRIFLYNVLN